MNEYIYVENVLVLLKRVDYFRKIIEHWKDNSNSMIDYSNDNGFRDMIRKEIWAFIENYNVINKYDFVTLEALRNFVFIYEEKSTLSNDDSLFVYNMRNYITIDKFDNRVFATYNGFLEGKIDKRIIEHSTIDINDYREYFESNIRNSNINNNKMHSVIYGAFLGIFSLIEYLMKEIQLLGLYQESLFTAFSKYYKTSLKSDKKLDEYIHIDITRVNDNINQYLSRDLICKYYNINNE